MRSDIEQKKQKSTPAPAKLTDNTPTIQNSPPPNVTSTPEIIKLASQTIVDVESIEVPEPELKEPLPVFDVKIEAGWYVFEVNHLVFCGDTATPDFHSHINDVSLAVAATSEYWDHDWLINVAATLIVLEESALGQDKLEQLINMFSQPEEAIVFPWLPHSYMIRIANKLNRKVIAGDISQENCSQAIASSGLDFAALKL